MSSPRPVIVKRPVDTNRDNGATLPTSGDPEREFLLEMRRAKLQELHAIERRLQITHGRCVHCKNLTI